MNRKTPQHGEIWLIRLWSGRGSEQRGTRPVLIIQNDIGNKYAGTTIVAAVTTKIKKYPITVGIPAGTADLLKESMVNCGQIFTIDKARLIKKIGVLEAHVMRRVHQALNISLALL